MTGAEYIKRTPRYMMDQADAPAVWWMLRHGYTIDHLAACTRGYTKQRLYRLATIGIELSKREAK